MCTKRVYVHIIHAPRKAERKMLQLLKMGLMNHRQVVLLLHFLHLIQKKKPEKLYSEDQEDDKDRQSIYLCWLIYRATACMLKY